MAQVYVSQGISERQAQFDYFFRSAPDYGTHQAGFCVSAGLGPFLDWLGSLAITSDHTDALAAMTSPAGTPVFSAEFLDWLARARTVRRHRGARRLGRARRASTRAGRSR